MMLDRFKNAASPLIGPCLLALFTLSTCYTFGQTPEKLPNVIMIYVDDLGYGDLSCYGATKIKTPNIDALAQNGLRFSRGHASSATCTPSRFALMTGVYPWREKGHNILPGDAALIVPTDKITLPRLFKNAGYHTGIVGKWHLGLGEKLTKDWNAEIKPGPNEVGFDYSFIFPATADRVPTVFMENSKILGLSADDPIVVNYKTKVGTDPTGKENPELLKLNSSVGHNHTIVNGIGRIGYMSGGKLARWTDEELAGTFLSKAQHFLSDNRKSPFFLYYAVHQIHVPRMPATMFKGQSALGYRGDAILELDWVVGELTNKLKELNLLENTIIIFTSDNGPVLDDGYADGAVALTGDHKPAGPLRGWKTERYEGGTRVPFIVTWPARIKPGTSDALVCQIDLLASFAKFFHQDLDHSEASDSQNILGSLLGESKNGRTVLVEEGYGDLAIVAGDWKLIPGEGKKKTELYNLKNDIGEKNNLADSNPEKVKELTALLERETGKK